jgi:arsenical pump membrane protein
MMVGEAAALVALAASLAAAVARPRWAPDWAVALLAAAALAAGGVLRGHEASAALRHLGPTVGFLAALLVLAYGCRKAGLFDALGREMANGARGRGSRRRRGPTCLRARTWPTAPRSCFRSPI